ncbi:MAG: MAPEG family protein [Mangrovicoccus sp.]
MISSLDSLALYGLLVVITLILQAIGALQQLGIGYLLSSRDEHRSLEGMTARLDRALNNSITAMALFAPAVLLIHTQNITTPYVDTVALVFLIARLVYLPCYVFDIQGLRSGAWGVGFFATLALYTVALTY